MGKWVVFLAAAVLITALGKWTATFILPAIIAIHCWPSQRPLILSLASIPAAGFLFKQYQWSFETIELTPSTILPAVVILAVLILLLQRWVLGAGQPCKPLPKRPQLTLHMILVGGSLLGLSILPKTNWASNSLVLVASVLPYFVWRFGYLVKWRQKKGALPKSFTAHLFWLLPAWGGSMVPYGKGGEYLKSNEATDRRAFAHSQLAGIKLLLLAVLWKILADLMRQVFYRKGYWTSFIPERLTFGIPDLKERLLGVEATVPGSWLCLYLELFLEVLALAATGHLIIGIVRLFGYNVFRNTYKPLLAETILEFWGRFYYYFKELLLDHFFYPSFLRLSRFSRNVRMFIALFSAVCLGNFYYHMLYHIPDIAVGEFKSALHYATTIGPYMLLLALGIFVSMMREAKRRKEPTSSTWVRCRRMLAVWSFFAIIHIWNVSSPASLSDRFQFLASLVGL